MKHHPRAERSRQFVTSAAAGSVVGSTILVGSFVMSAVLKLR